MRGARRILITADPLGGVWNYTLTLLRGLSDHRFLLCTMGRPLSEEQSATLAALSHVERAESSFALEWMDDPWPEVERAGEWLREKAREFRPDLLHLNGYAHAAYSWPAPVLVVAHSCVFSWWRSVHGEEPPARYANYYARVSAGLAAADLVVAPTRAMLEALRENYGGSFRGEVVVNGSEAVLGIKQSKQPVILAAGRFWDQAKNLQALDQAAAELCWPLEIAGDVVHPDGGAKLWKGACTIGRLNAKALAAKMSAASIFVAPARYEPFGLAILEAARHGCALVLGDIASLRELWQDCAIFVKPDDSAQLVRILNQLVQDAARLTDLGTRARNRAMEFCSRKMVESYAAVYDRLIAGRARVAA